MRMRRLQRREKELLTQLTVDGFRVVPRETLPATVANLEAHKLVISARMVDERGVPMVALQLTTTGAAVAAKYLAATNRGQHHGGVWLAHSEPDKPVVAPAD